MDTPRETDRACGPARSERGPTGSLPRSRHPANPSDSSSNRRARPDDSRRSPGSFGFAAGATWSPVHFELNHHALVRGDRAALAKRFADLLERLLLGNLLDEAVRPHLHARRTEIARQTDPLLGLIDVLAKHLWVSRLILAGRSETANLHGRVLEPFPHLRPRRRRQRNLDPMLVRRSQLDRLEAGVGEVLDERRKVPILRNVVGDGAELQAPLIG